MSEPKNIPTSFFDFEAWRPQFAQLPLDGQLKIEAQLNVKKGSIGGDGYILANDRVVGLKGDVNLTAGRLMLALKQPLFDLENLVLHHPNPPWMQPDKVIAKNAFIVPRGTKNNPQRNLKINFTLPNGHDFGLADFEMTDLAEKLPLARDAQGRELFDLRELLNALDVDYLGILQAEGIANHRLRDPRSISDQLIRRPGYEFWLSHLPPDTKGITVFNTSFQIRDSGIPLDLGVVDWANFISQLVPPEDAQPGDSQKNEYAKPLLDTLKTHAELTVGTEGASQVLWPSFLGAPAIEADLEGQASFKGDLSYFTQAGGAWGASATLKGLDIRSLKIADRPKIQIPLAAQANLNALFLGGQWTGASLSDWKLQFTDTGFQARIGQGPIEIPANVIPGITTPGLRFTADPSADNQIALTGLTGTLTAQGLEAPHAKLTMSLKAPGVALQIPADWAQALGLDQKPDSYQGLLGATNLDLGIQALAGGDFKANLALGSETDLTHGTTQIKGTHRLELTTDHAVLTPTEIKAPFTVKGSHVLDLKRERHTLHTEPSYTLEGGFDKTTGLSPLHLKAVSERNEIRILDPRMSLTSDFKTSVDAQNITQNQGDWTADAQLAAQSKKTDIHWISGSGIELTQAEFKADGRLSKEAKRLSLSQARLEALAEGTVRFLGLGALASVKFTSEKSVIERDAASDTTQAHLENARLHLNTRTHIPEWGSDLEVTVDASDDYVVYDQGSDEFALGLSPNLDIKGTLRSKAAALKFTVKAFPEIDVRGREDQVDVQTLKSPFALSIQGLWEGRDIALDYAADLNIEEKPESFVITLDQNRQPNRSTRLRWGDYTFSGQVGGDGAPIRFIIPKDIRGQAGDRVEIPLSLRVEGLVDGPLSQQWSMSGTLNGTTTWVKHFDSHGKTTFLPEIGTTNFSFNGINLTRLTRDGDKKIVAKNCRVELQDGASYGIDFFAGCDSLPGFGFAGVSQYMRLNGVPWTLASSQSGDTAALYSLLPPTSAEISDFDFTGTHRAFGRVLAHIARLSLEWPLKASARFNMKDGNISVEKAQMGGLKLSEGSLKNLQGNERALKGRLKLPETLKYRSKQDGLDLKVDLRLAGEAVVEMNVARKSVHLEDRRVKISGTVKATLATSEGPKELIFNVDQTSPLVQTKGRLWSKNAQVGSRLEYSVPHLNLKLDLAQSTFMDTETLGRLNFEKGSSLVLPLSGLTGQIDLSASMQGLLAGRFKASADVDLPAMRRAILNLVGEPFKDSKISHTGESRIEFDLDPAGHRAKLSGVQGGMRVSSQGSVTPLKTEILALFGLDGGNGGEPKHEVRASITTKYKKADIILSPKDGVSGLLDEPEVTVERMDVKTKLPADHPLVKMTDLKGKTLDELDPRPDAKKRIQLHPQGHEPQSQHNRSQRMEPML